MAWGSVVPSRQILGANSPPFGTLSEWHARLALPGGRGRLRPNACLRYTRPLWPAFYRSKSRWLAQGRPSLCFRGCGLEMSP